MPKSGPTPTQLQDLRGCACLALRRAARIVTQRYDAALRPFGVRAGQLSILTAAASAPGAPLAALAEALGMDRTTLLRNVRPMVRKRWLEVRQEAGSRRAEVRATAKGRELLARVYPVWRRVQDDVSSQLPDPGFRHALRRPRRRDARAARRRLIFLPSCVHMHRKEPQMKPTTDPRTARARTATVLALAAWLVAALLGGLLGVVNQAGRLPLVLLTYIALPILGFIAAYALSGSFRAFADRLSLTLLVASHLWRFVGLGFIVAWLNGDLPAGFAIPEGLGDIAAAAGALALLPGIVKGTASRRWLLAWNVFGLVDLVSAITMGVLYSDGPLGILGPGTVTTTLMVTFPVSLIPTFFVPLFILLHLLTFKRIAAMTQSSNARATHAATAVQHSGAR